MDGIIRRDLCSNVSNLDELFFYISGASPGIDIIIDDVTLTTAPGNNLDIDGDGLQDFGKLLF